MLADVVIPSKSNTLALTMLVNRLNFDRSVRKIVVVADGDAAFLRISESAIFKDKLEILLVPEGVGIHVMWNLGMEHCDPENHLLFLNDDVDVNPSTVVGLINALENYPEVALVGPNFSPKKVGSPIRYVNEVCCSRYNEPTTLAGFAMMLRNTLIPSWRFDERMKWWYGDNDILTWVIRSLGMKAAICEESTCSANCSWTINNDPPKNFGQDVENDHRIFIQKWGQ